MADAPQFPMGELNTPVPSQICKPWGEGSLQWLEAKASLYWDSSFCVHGVSLVAPSYPGEG